MEAIVSGKQTKLMVKPRNEDVWYRSVVDARGHSPDSVRFDHAKKGKVKVVKAKNANKSSRDLTNKRECRRTVNLHPRPVLALAFAAVVAEPSTSAFLSALATPHNLRTKAKWESVRRLLARRKSVLLKQVAIVDSQLNQVDIEIGEMNAKES